MLKLANQVLDFYDDVERAPLKKLAALKPDLQVMSPDERSALRDGDFALSLITKKASKLNKFPVNNYDNTWLSNQYFEMTHGNLPKQAAAVAAFHIKRACERFSIAAEPAAASLAKEAASNVYFEGTEPVRDQTRSVTVSLEKLAAVADISDNPTHAQYAMASPAAVKVACKYFDEKHKEMPVDYRHKYAAAIQRRAHELGMGAQKGTVEKYASDHYSGALDAHLRSRASLLEYRDPSSVAQLEKLAAAKKDLTPTQFAQALSAFDKRASLTQYYGGHLQDPFLATFGKEPDPYAGWRFKTAGLSLQADDIQKIATLKYAEVKNYFGTSLADAFRKDPVSIFESLPMDAKEIIAGIASGTA